MDHGADSEAMQRALTFMQAQDWNVAAELLTAITEDSPVRSVGKRTAVAGC